MNDLELLRVLNFISRTRNSFTKLVPGADVDASWNITAYLCKAELLNRKVSTTELIEASGMPYGTASRRIQKLLASGDIVKQPAREVGASFYLAASASLRQSVTEYAHRIKSMLAEVAGQRSDSHVDDHYYLGDLQTSIKDLLPPEALRLTLKNGSYGLKFLFHDDNYFTSVRDLWTDFRANAGSREDFTLLKLPDLYETLLRNATLPVSAFDVVALNFPWLPEFASKDLVTPLAAHADERMISGKDFHPSVWESGAYDTEQFGVPLYVTVEGLAARKDLFTEANLGFPRTLKDLLAAARHLHAPRRKRHGLSWNAARGMPIASAFMFFLNAHEGRVLEREDAATLRGQTRWTSAMLSEASQRTLRFMRELRAVSSPDVLEYDWNRSLQEFMAGNSAMCYTWSMRAARFELDLMSRVKGKVQYLPQPNLSGARCIVPVGGFLLAIPSNLPPERAALALQSIQWMTSSNAMRSQVRNGLPVAPRFSVSSDPEMRATSPIVGFVDHLAQQNLLSPDMRPLTPVYTRIEEVLGEEIHDALTDKISDQQALEQAHGRIQRLLDTQVLSPA